MGVVADWIVSFRSMLGEKGPLAAQLKAFYEDEQDHLRFVDEKLAATA